MFPQEIRGLKATRLGEFTRVVNGQAERRYRFAITGTPAALAAWKKARGQYYIEDEVTKQVIFIAIPNVAIELAKAGGKMLISTNGSVRPDYDSLEELIEDDFMYRQALATAKAQHNVGLGRVSGRTFGQSAAARNFNVPNQDTIDANAASAVLSDEQMNAGNEPELSAEEKAALAGATA